MNESTWVWSWWKRCGFFFYIVPYKDMCKADLYILCMISDYFDCWREEQANRETRLVCTPSAEYGRSRVVPEGGSYEAKRNHPLIYEDWCGGAPFQEGPHNNDPNGERGWWGMPPNDHHTHQIDWWFNDAGTTKLKCYNKLTQLVWCFTLND